MIYTYGLEVGTKLLARGKIIPGLKHLVIPVAYWRTTEFGLTMRYGEFQRTDVILDIGSPKLLSLYLAKTLGADVYSTDIDGYFLPEYQPLREIEGLSPNRFHIEVEHGRELRYPDAFFDKVFSVAVVEHIPDDGDGACLREIGRVLKPGGRCMLTVPFGRTPKNQYRNASDFYWSNLSTKAEDGSVFFQRRYDETGLYERLIHPSGLSLKHLLFVGERVFEASDREFIEHLPPLTEVLLGPAQASLDRLLQTAPTTDWHSLKKPLCAFITLEKPATP